MAVVPLGTKIASPVVGERRVVSCMAGNEERSQGDEVSFQKRRPESSKSISEGEGETNLAVSSLERFDRLEELRERTLQGLQRTKRRESAS